MIKAKRLPVDAGISGWNAILSEPGPPRELTKTSKADFVVVGAGFAGLAAAARLVQLAPNAAIALVEAKRVGEGPAGRNSGFMIDLPHELTSADYSGGLENDRKTIDLNRQAIDFAASLASQNNLDSGIFNRTGKVNAAVGGKGLRHNESYARHLEQLGEPYSLLDNKQMQGLTGSAYYQGGLHTPGTATIQPAAYVRGLASGLSSKIQIFENSPVTGMQRNSGLWRLETPKGNISADKVILATNGHVESFGFFKRRLVHIMLFASMTRALNSEQEKLLGGEPVWGLTPSDPAATTVRKISGPDGPRIVVRNRAVYTPDLCVLDRVVEQMGKTHDHSFIRRFPQVADVDMEYRWAGRLCLSLNNVPAFGEIGDGLYSACCQNGLGTVKGTLSGMAIAELLVEGLTPLARQMANYPEPARLPPAPLDRIGATARIHWSEFCAGTEM